MPETTAPRWTACSGHITPVYTCSALPRCITLYVPQWVVLPILTIQTDGDPRWKERTEGILKAADVFFTDKPKDVLYERACEPVDTCKVDQRSFKGYLARWMAASTQLAPFTYDRIMPKLRASASAAAKTCAGGPRNTSCGLKWTDQKYTKQPLDIGLEMAALDVIQSTLIHRIEAPVTREDGGLSKGNPAAGSENPRQSLPDMVTRNISVADRVGAGILTVLMAGAVVATVRWVIMDPHI